MFHKTSVFCDSHTMEDIHSSYYHNQAFNGGSTGPYFVGSYNYQRGSGIGSFFSSIFRYFKPIFASGIRSLGKEAISTGSKILTDLSTTTQSPSDVIKMRTKEGVSRLQSKLMTGDGIGFKRKTTTLCPQLLSKRPRVGRKASSKKKPKGGKRRKTKKRSKKHLVAPRDIFN